MKNKSTGNVVTVKYKIGEKDSESFLVVDSWFSTADPYTVSFYLVNCLKSTDSWLFLHCFVSSFVIRFNLLHC